MQDRLNYWNLDKLNTLEIINKVNSLKEEVDAVRPLSREQEDRVMQKLRLEWNYNSNAIEGNTLNYGETVAFLMHGLTSKGKPFKDYLDIKGHNNAINILARITKGDEDITQRLIRELHEVLLGEDDNRKAPAIDSLGKEIIKTIKVGEYKTSSNHVKTATGEIHYYATPEETPAKMGDLIDWYNKNKDKGYNPLIIAGIFHHQFVAIHPFDDGNGRMTRLLMNLILMRAGYPPLVVRGDKSSRGEYYNTLSQADAGDIVPFIELLATELSHSLELYLKGARGESLEDPDDFDKELALFKQEVNSRKDRIEIKGSLEIRKQVYEENFRPILDGIEAKLSKLKDLFLEHNILYIQDPNNNKEVYSKIEKEEILNLHLFSSNENPYPSKLIYVYRLTEFKSETNPFSLELQVHLVFYEYRYEIYYNFADEGSLNYYFNNNYLFSKGKTLCSNKYDESVREQIKKLIINEVSVELLKQIKHLDMNKKFLLPTKGLSLFQIWDDFSKIQDLPEFWGDIHIFKHSDLANISLDVSSIDFDQDEYDLWHILKDFFQYYLKNIKVDNVLIRVLMSLDGFPF